MLDGLAHVWHLAVVERPLTEPGPCALEEAQEQGLGRRFQGLGMVQRVLSVRPLASTGHRQAHALEAAVQSCIRLGSHSLVELSLSAVPSTGQGMHA